MAYGPRKLAATSPPEGLDSEMLLRPLGAGDLLKDELLPLLLLDLHLGERGRREAEVERDWVVGDAVVICVYVYIYIYISLSLSLSLELCIHLFVGFKVWGLGSGIVRLQLYQRSRATPGRRLHPRCSAQPKMPLSKHLEFRPGRGHPVDIHSSRSARWR